MKKETCIRENVDKDQIDRCNFLLEENRNSFAFLSKVLSLSGNEVRLKILFLLSKEGKLCVCDLSDILNMKVAAVSQHLRKLKDAQILINEREAQTIFYSINPGLASNVDSILKLLNTNEVEV